MNLPLFPHRVYVGCSLTYAPEQFKQDVETLKKELRKICHVLCFLGISDFSPRSVYNHDIGHCISTCDLFLAICDHPSTGLGYELGTQAEARRKPVLAVAHRNALVTDLILDTGLPHIEVRRYERLEEVINMVAEKLRQMEAQQHPLFDHLLQPQGVITQVAVA